MKYNSKNLKLPLHAYLSESHHSVKECAYHFNVSVSYAYSIIKAFEYNGEVTLHSTSGHTKYYKALDLKLSNQSNQIETIGKPRLISFANSTRPLSSDCIGSAKKSYGWEGYSSPLNKS